MGAILDTPNLHTSTSQGPESRLSSWSWSLGSVTSSSPELDVKGSDAKGLDLFSHILSSQHSSVWRGFISVGLDLHATSNSADCLTARQISYVNESVVEGSIDVGNAKTSSPSLTCGPRDTWTSSLASIFPFLGAIVVVTRSLVEVNQAILASLASLFLVIRVFNAFVEPIGHILISLCKILFNGLSSA